MQIWLDTVDLPLIGRAKKMGVVYGVTTNPSIISQSDMPLEDLVEKILEIQKGPVAVQVTAQDAGEMIRQAEALAGFSNRIIVKIPATEEGFQAICALSPRIPTMATAVFDVTQVLLSAKAGASYIAPYYSKICDADLDGIEVIRAMLGLLRRYNFSSQLLAASLRSPEQVKELAEMGAHAITVSKDVFVSLTEDHPLTKQSVRRFATDWTKAQKPRSLPL